MTQHFVLANARLVLADEVIERGWLRRRERRDRRARPRRAAGRAPRTSPATCVMPGLVELHTDHIEAHYMPRPKVHWDPVAAVVSYDAQLATCGITTVLDSLRVWREEGAEDVSGEAELLAEAITAARGARHAADQPLPPPALRGADAAASSRRRPALIDRDDVRLVSLMDHTPGQRQFRDEQKLRDYYRGKSGGLTDAELDVMFEKRREQANRHAAPNYRALVGARPRARHSAREPRRHHRRARRRSRSRTASRSPNFRPPSKRRRRCTPAACGC